MTTDEFTILMGAIGEVKDDVRALRDEVVAIKLARAEEKGRSQQTRFLANVSKESLAALAVVAALLSAFGDALVNLLTGHH